MRTPAIFPRPKSGTTPTKASIAVLPPFYANGGHPEGLKAPKVKDDSEEIIRKLREECAGLRAEVEILTFELTTA